MCKEAAVYYQNFPIKLKRNIIHQCCVYTLFVLPLSVSICNAYMQCNNAASGSFIKVESCNSSENPFLSSVCEFL